MARRGEIICSALSAPGVLLPLGCLLCLACFPKGPASLGSFVPVLFVLNIDVGVTYVRGNREVGIALYSTG